MQEQRGPMPQPKLDRGNASDNNPSITEEESTPIVRLITNIMAGVAVGSMGEQNPETAPLLLTSGKVTLNPLDEYNCNFEFRSSVIMGESSYEKVQVPVKNLFGKVKEGKFKTEKREITLDLEKRRDMFLAQLPKLEETEESKGAVFPTFVERLLVQANVTLDDKGNKIDWFTDSGELTEEGQLNIMIALEGFFQEAVDISDSSYADVLAELSQTLTKYKEAISGSSKSDSLSREVAGIILDADLATRLMLGNHMANPSMNFEGVSDLSFSQRQSVKDVPALDFDALAETAKNYARYQSQIMLPSEVAKSKRVFFGPDDKVGMTVHDLWMQTQSFESGGFNKFIEEAIRRKNVFEGTKLTRSDYLRAVHEHLRHIYDQEHKAIKAGELDPKDASLIMTDLGIVDEQSERYLDNSEVKTSGLTVEQQDAINKTLGMIRLTVVLAGLFTGVSGAVGALQDDDQVGHHYDPLDDDWTHYREATSGHGQMHNDVDGRTVSALREVAEHMGNKASSTSEERANPFGDGEFRVHRVDSGRQPMVHREPSHTGGYKIGGGLANIVDTDNPVERSALQDAMDIAKSDDNVPFESSQNNDSLAEDAGSTDIEGDDSDMSVQPAVEDHVAQPGVQLTHEQIERFTETDGTIFRLEHGETISHALAAKGISQEEMYGKDGESGIIKQLETNSYATFTHEGKTYVTLVVQDKPTDSTNFVNIVTPGTEVTREGANVIFVEVDTDALSNQQPGEIITKLQDVFHSGTITDANLDDAINTVAEKINLNDTQQALLASSQPIELSSSTSLTKDVPEVVDDYQEVDQLVGAPVFADQPPDNVEQEKTWGVRLIPVRSENSSKVDEALAITPVIPYSNPDGSISWQYDSFMGDLGSGSRLLVGRVELGEVPGESNQNDFLQTNINNAPPPVEGRDYIRLSTIEEGSTLRNIVESHDLSLDDDENFTPTSTYVGTTVDGNWRSFAQNAGLPDNVQPEFRNGIWTTSIFREDGSRDLVHFRAYTTDSEGVNHPVDSTEDGNLPPGTTIAVVNTNEFITKDDAIEVVNNTPVHVFNESTIETSQEGEAPILEEQIPEVPQTEDIITFQELEIESQAIASEIKKNGVAVTTPEGRVEIKVAVDSDNNIVSGENIPSDTKILSFEITEAERPQDVAGMIELAEKKVAELEAGVPVVEGTPEVEPTLEATEEVANPSATPPQTGVVTQPSATPTGTATTVQPSATSTISATTTSDVVDPSATPTSTEPSATPSPTASPTATATAFATATETLIAPTVTNTPSPTTTSTPTATVAPTEASPTATATVAVPSATPSATATENIPQASATPSATATIQAPVASPTTTQEATTAPHFESGVNAFDGETIYTTQGPTDLYGRVIASNLNGDQRWVVTEEGFIFVSNEANNDPELMFQLQKLGTTFSSNVTTVDISGNNATHLSDRTIAPGSMPLDLVEYLDENIVGKDILPTPASQVVIPQASATPSAMATDQSPSATTTATPSATATEDIPEASATTEATENVLEASPVASPTVSPTITSTSAPLTTEGTEEVTGEVQVPPAPSATPVNTLEPAATEVIETETQAETSTTGSNLRSAGLVLLGGGLLGLGVAGSIALSKNSKVQEFSRKFKELVKRDKSGIKKTIVEATTKESFPPVEPRAVELDSLTGEVTEIVTADEEGTRSETIEGLSSLYTETIAPILEGKELDETDLDRLENIVREAKAKGTIRLGFRHNDILPVTNSASDKGRVYRMTDPGRVNPDQARSFCVASPSRAGIDANEDSFGVFALTDSLWGMVLDGVGSMKSSSAKMGEDIVTKIVSASAEKGEPLTLIEIVLQTNDKLLNEDAKGATTITLFRINRDGTLEYAGVGDSPLVVINTRKGTVDILPRMNTVARTFATQNSQLGLDSEKIDLAILDGERDEIDDQLENAFQPVEGKVVDYEQTISLAINVKNLREKEDQIDHGIIQLEPDDVVIASSDGFFPGNMSATELYLAVKAGMTIEEIEKLVLEKAKYDLTMGQVVGKHRIKSDDMTAIIVRPSLEEVLETAESVVEVSDEVPQVALEDMPEAESDVGHTTSSHAERAEKLEEVEEVSSDDQGTEKILAVEGVEDRIETNVNESPVTQEFLTQMSVNDWILASLGKPIKIGSQTKTLADITTENLEKIVQETGIHEDVVIELASRGYIDPDGELVEAVGRKNIELIRSFTESRGKEEHIRRLNDIKDSPTMYLSSDLPQSLVTEVEARLEDYSDQEKGDDNIRREVFGVLIKGVIEGKYGVITRNIPGTPKRLGLKELYVIEVESIQGDTTVDELEPSGPVADIIDEVAQESALSGDKVEITGTEVVQEDSGPIEVDTKVEVGPTLLEIFPSLQATNLLIGSPIPMNNPEDVPRIIDTLNKFKKSLFRIDESNRDQLIDDLKSGAQRLNVFLSYSFNSPGRYTFNLSEGASTDLHIGENTFEQSKAEKLLFCHFIRKLTDYRGQVSYEYDKGRLESIKRGFEDIGKDPNRENVSLFIWMYAGLNPDAEIPASIIEVMESKMEGMTIDNMDERLDEVAEFISQEMRQGRVKLVLEDLSAEYEGLDVQLGKFVSVESEMSEATDDAELEQEIVDNNGINPILSEEEKRIVDKALAGMKEAYYMDTQVLGIKATPASNGVMQINTMTGLSGHIERQFRFPTNKMGSGHHVRGKAKEIFEGENVLPEFAVSVPEHLDRSYQINYYGAGVLRVFPYDPDGDSTPSYSLMMFGYVSTAGEKGRGLSGVELDFVFENKEERDTFLDKLVESDDPKRLIAGLINQTFQDAGEPATILNVEDDNKSPYEHPIHDTHRIIFYDPQSKRGKILERTEDGWSVEYESEARMEDAPTAEEAAEVLTLRIPDSEIIGIGIQKSSFFALRYGYKLPEKDREKISTYLREHGGEAHLTEDFEWVSSWAQKHDGEFFSFNFYKIPDTSEVGIGENTIELNKAEIAELVKSGLLIYSKRSNSWTLSEFYLPEENLANYTDTNGYLNLIDSNLLLSLLTIHNLPNEIESELEKTDNIIEYKNVIFRALRSGEYELQAIPVVLVTDKIKSFELKIVKVDIKQLETKTKTEARLEGLTDVAKLELVLDISGDIFENPLSDSSSLKFTLQQYNGNQKEVLDVDAKTYRRVVRRRLGPLSATAIVNQERVNSPDSARVIDQETIINEKIAILNQQFKAGDEDGDTTKSPNYIDSLRNLYPKLPEGIYKELEGLNDIDEYKRKLKLAIEHGVRNGKYELKARKVDGLESLDGHKIDYWEIEVVEVANQMKQAEDLPDGVLARVGVEGAQGSTQAGSEDPEYEQLFQQAVNIGETQAAPENYLPREVGRVKISKDEFISLELSTRAQIDLLLRRDISNEEEFKKFTYLVDDKLQEGVDYHYYLVQDESDDATSVAFYSNPPYQLSIPLSNGTQIPLEAIEQELLFMKGMLGEHSVRASDGSVQKVLSLMPVSTTVDSYLSMINPPKGAGFAHYRGIDIYDDDPDAKDGTVINRVSHIADIQRLAFALSAELPEEVLEEISKSSQGNQGIVTRRMMFDVIDGKIQSGEYLVDKRESYLSPEGIELFEFVLIKNPNYDQVESVKLEQVDRSIPEGLESQETIVHGRVVQDSEPKAITTEVGGLNKPIDIPTTPQEALEVIADDGVSEQRLAESDKKVIDYTPVDLTSLTDLLKTEILGSFSEENRNKLRELLENARKVEIEDTNINSQQFLNRFIESLRSNLSSTEASELKVLLSKLRRLPIKNASKSWRTYTYRDFYYSLIKELLDTYNNVETTAVVDIAGEDLF